MTKKDLIKALEPYDDYVCVLHKDKIGWTNINAIEPSGSSCVYLITSDHVEDEKELSRLQCVAKDPRHAT